MHAYHSHTKLRKIGPQFRRQFRLAATPRLSNRPLPLCIVKPEWSRATPRPKLAQAFVELYRINASIFTLRLGQKALKELGQAADPAREMSTRIQRAFARRNRPVPMMAFILEVTPGERQQLHVHGAIDDREVPLALLKEIFCEAGDKIHGHAGSTQIKLQPFELPRGGPLGWATYVFKDHARTSRAMGTTKTTYICQKLNSVDKTCWEQDRASLKITRVLPH